MARIRFSKKLYRSLSTELAQTFQRFQQRWPGIKSFDIRNEPAGWRNYHGEGEHYTYFYAGQEMSLQMVSESTIGASGVRYEIGAESPPLPAGTLVFRVWYAGSSGYQLTIHSVGPEQYLPA